MRELEETREVIGIVLPAGSLMMNSLKSPKPLRKQSRQDCLSALILRMSELPSKSISLLMLMMKMYELKEKYTNNGAQNSIMNGLRLENPS